jgi:hypothetical protein
MVFPRNDNIRTFTVKKIRAVDFKAVILRFRFTFQWLINLWLYKKKQAMGFTLHIPPRAPHTNDLVVLTSLTHPRKILLDVLQIEK